MIIVTITSWFISKSISNFDAQFEKTLVLEVETISKMFERERILKLENVQSNLKVASDLFNSGKLDILDKDLPILVENQNTGNTHNTFIKRWLYNNEDLYNSTIFVDSMQALFGGTITIFQKIDSGFVRLSTNVKKTDGNRAVGTFIPNNSPIIKSITNNETFYGRAYVVNDWYITAYKPLIKNNKLVGMIYVGDREKNLNEIKKILSHLKIGKSGYPFVFDKKGYMFIHPEMESKVFNDTAFFNKIGNKKSGVFKYDYKGLQKTVAFVYFEPFEVYIAASIINAEENKDFITDAFIGTTTVSLIAIILILGFIYYFTSERLSKFYNKLQISNKTIVSISEALKESEERFQKLFDSTGDDIFVTDIDENIVEINDAACNTLGYSREELLSMKITSLKSLKYINSVAENRSKIYEMGTYTFESEHITKDGAVVPVEFISRVVSYKNEKLILSVVRNLSQRKELERKILSAVIHAEERERERFAKDMHDGLGPLLSTIKLYVNELKPTTLNQKERDDLIKSSNELIDEAVNSTRTISNNLMPRIINTFGLIKAVDEFCNKINKTNKLNIAFETENIPDRLNHDLEIILFRVISELINNTIKHAGAAKVLILLTREKDTISLYYKDDGVGFDVDNFMKSEQKGMGLKNVISRVKSINGNYTFNSAPNKGFLIKIVIKL